MGLQFLYIFVPTSGEGYYECGHSVCVCVFTLFVCLQCLENISPDCDEIWNANSLHNADVPFSKIRLRIL